MWISKKKLNVLEKRIADLEDKTQSQQSAISSLLENQEKETEELKIILENIKGMFRKEMRDYVCNP